MQCRFCKTEVPADAYYCPNCGKEQKPIPPGTSFGRQALVYAVSAFLPPLGLWYAWKYFKAGDETSRIIGIIAVILTAISVGVSIWLFDGILNSFNQSLNALNGLY